MPSNLDLARILQLFVVQPIMGLFFIYLSTRILKKNKSRLNISFSLLYLVTTFGIFLNIIYSLIYVEFIVLVFNFITNFATTLGLIFLLSTNQIILKSELVFTKWKQGLLVIIYAILLLLMVIFYPFGGGVTINEYTDWKPVWNLPIFIYFITIVTLVAVIPILYTSIKIYNEFENKKLKKRWSYFIIGTIGLIVYLYGVFINNLINLPMVRLGFSLFGLTVFLWTYLIYYGIGRQIE